VQRWQGLDAVPPGWGQCVVTIGVFDGIHRGHQEIIREAVQLARERGVPSVLLTFLPHPSEVVRPGTHPPMLTTFVRRAELAEELGIDVFCALPFTVEFSRMAPAAFAHAALVERLHASGVVVGENFHFGHRAAGDVAQLTEVGKQFGFSVRGVELLQSGGTRISATVARTRVLAGDMRGATDILGRPHRVDGVVELGEQRGRELGFPTANLRTEKWAAVPDDGVYAGRVVRLDDSGRTVAGGAIGTAAISVGTNPTFDDVLRRRVEACILDWSGDLYGASIGVEFVDRLRGMVKYDGIDPLIEQMNADVVRVREIMA